MLPRSECFTVHTARWVRTAGESITHAAAEASYDRARSLAVVICIIVGHFFMSTVDGQYVALEFRSHCLRLESSAVRAVFVLYSGDSDVYLSRCSTAQLGELTSDVVHRCPLGWSVFRSSDTKDVSSQAAQDHSVHQQASYARKERLSFLFIFIL